jgi:hypothetical protein
MRGALYYQKINKNRGALLKKKILYVFKSASCLRKINNILFGTMKIIV